MYSREGSERPRPVFSRVTCDCSSGVMSSTETLLDNRSKNKKFNLLDIPLGYFVKEFVSLDVGATYRSGRSRKRLTESCHRLSHLFWNIFYVFFLDKRMFIFLILLNPLLIDSSPMHRETHRKLRHTIRSDPHCDKPQFMDHPHDQECRRFRVRRDIHHMNLREGENSTVCDYRVCVDKNPNRMPQQIHRVFCVESGCRCQEEGSYRCTQLTDKVEVWYGVSQGMPRVDRVDVEVGCVCAAKRGIQLENFNPSISVDK